MNVILAQTDTTVGLLSQDAERLKAIKSRGDDKPFLKVFADFQTLKIHTRIPNRHKIRVRHARKTTFIVKNQAFRYVSDPNHAPLVSRFGWLYSSSANPGGGRYDFAFCSRHADWIVEDVRGLFETSSSRILKLTHSRIQKIR